MRIESMVTVSVALLALCIASCDQSDVTLPEIEQNTAGQCGDWYPTSVAEDGSELPHDVAEGATFPCLVWNSVRQAGLDTWFNAGERYLEVSHGASDRKAIVLLISGRGCPACVGLVGGIAELKEEFEAEAVMIGVALATPGELEGFTLDGAETQLIDADGWPADWLVTNDAEGHLTGYQSFPWIVVVRMSDMQVVAHTNDTYSEGNVEALLELVRGL